MSIKYSFDIFQIYKVADKYVLLLSGWCVDTEGDVPSISIEINGKKESVELFRTKRVDVCRCYNLDENKYCKCGFRTKYVFEGNIDYISILANKKSILKLTDKKVKELIQNQSIAFDFEEYSQNQDIGIITVKGWCFSLLDEKVDIKVIDHFKKEIEFKLQEVQRNDLLIFTNQVCGFQISFHYEANEKYFVVFKTKSGEFVLALDSCMNKTNVTRKSFFEHINLDNMKLGLTTLKEEGFLNTIKWLMNHGERVETYQNWFKRHKVTKEELNRQKEISFSYSPKISILVPTYNTPIKLLKEMIDSVRNQSYSNWELCIADGSSDSNTKKIIQEYVNKDSRIKVNWLNQNYGISGNTNHAMGISSGDYIALFDHDDVLEPDALFEVVQSLQEKKHDIVYTDEDKLNNETGEYVDPNFKTDWNLDLFRSHNYITHLFVVKSSIVKEVGGFQSEYDGAQDYDLMFRCIEKSKSIYHIPKILYHWRIHEGSTAGDPESKMYAYEAGRKAIQAHLDRMHVKGKAIMLEKPLYGLYRVEYEMDEEPLVSTIIPNYEHVDVLKTCIDSLYEVNTYSNIEIIIVENNSKKQETFEYYESLKKEHDNIKVVTWNDEFNYSAINNFGVKHARGEYILLLNNDTEVIGENALKEMVSNCMREEVGVVGAKLLYADDTIQHAGVVIGFDGYAGHIFTNLMNDDYGYMMRAIISSDYSAVTAACLMTKKSIWNEVGGLDEQFKVACNDVDYCLKVRDLNKLVVYDAFSLWHHYESKSRGYEDSPEKKARYEDEVNRWAKKWNKYLPNNDPYYNKNFDIEKGPFRLD